MCRTVKLAIFLTFAFTVTVMLAGEFKGALADGVNQKAAKTAVHLVVVDPPMAFEPDVKRLGFSISEKLRLDSLGMTVIQLRIPVGFSPSKARTLLQSHYPEIVFDDDLISWKEMAP